MPSKANRPAWIQSAYDGIAASLDLINEKRIKVIVNGGGLDPKGLALEVDKLVCLGFLTVYYVRDPRGLTTRDV